MTAGRHAVGRDPMGVATGVATGVAMGAVMSEAAAGPDRVIDAVPHPDRSNPAASPATHRSETASRNREWPSVPGH